jgi:hypothetical protein
MSREPEGQGDNSQGRIGKTAGGKNRAARDEEIRHVMHPAVGIDHAAPGIVVHPGCAQEVMRAVESPGLGADTFLHGDESAYACGSQFLAKNLLRLADAAQDLARSSARAPWLFAGRKHQFAPVKRCGLSSRCRNGWGGSPAFWGNSAMLRPSMPPEKARASDQELVQDSWPTSPQVLEMRHEDRAEIKHFLPAHHFRPDVELVHHGLALDIVLIVQPSLAKNRF